MHSCIVHAPVWVQVGKVQWGCGTGRDTNISHLQRWKQLGHLAHHDCCMNVWMWKLFSLCVCVWPYMSVCVPSAGAHRHTHTHSQYKTWGLLSTWYVVCVANSAATKNRSVPITQCPPPLSQNHILFSQAWQHRRQGMVFIHWHTVM